MKLFLAVLLAVSLLSGCLAHSEPEIPAHVRELDNVTVIPAVDEMHELELVPMESYGSTDEVLISRPGGVAVDDQNRVYLMDSGQKVIHVFNPDGSYLKPMGREGRGPGEFQRPGTAAIHGHSLFVQDMMLQRINIFDLSTLEFSATISYDIRNRSAYPELEEYNPGHFLAINDSTILVGFRKSTSTLEMSEPRLIFFHTVNSQGQIRSKEPIELRDREFMTMNSDGNQFATLFSFNQMYLIEISDDGNIYTAGNDEFLIREYNAEGEYQRALYHSYPKSPLLREQLLEEYDLDMHQKLLRGSELPETWPALRSLHVDDENRFWISVYGENGDDSSWWVLDKDGAVLGTFTIPEDGSFRYARNGSAYISIPDENDERRVVRYQVF